MRSLVGLSSSGSAAASSTGAIAVNVGAVSTCARRVYDNGCEEKRSCRDCLNLALDDNLACYLDVSSGTCSAFSDVSPVARDATAAATPNATERLQLLARNFGIYASTTQRYCSVNDGACTLCQAVADLKGYAPSSNQLKRMSSDRNLCYGANNCICVATCEGQAWMSSAGKRCASADALPAYNTPSPSSDSTKTKMLLFIGLFGALQFCVLAFLVIRKKRELRRRREANGPYNTAGILSDENRLQLPGWMAWQRELRDQEENADAPYITLHKLRPSSQSQRHTLAMTASSDGSLGGPLPAERLST